MNYHLFVFKTLQGSVSTWKQVEDREEPEKKPRKEAERKEGKRERGRARGNPVLGLPSILHSFDKYLSSPFLCARNKFTILSGEDIHQSRLSLCHCEL